MKISKEEKGITLIALVVTIIVLIILAGISIRALSGDSSVIINAKQAKCMHVYYGEDDTIKSAYIGIFSDIKAKSAQDVKYDARTKENVIKFAKNIARDLDKEKYSIAYRYVEGETINEDKAYIWVKVADSVLKEGAIQKKEEDGATYNKPLHDGNAVARITIEKHTSSYAYDVDIENDEPETGDAVIDKTLMVGVTFKSFMKVSMLKGEESGGETEEPKENHAPSIANVTQTDTQKNSFTIEAVSNDIDENDKLIYKVYTGNKKENITNLEYTSPKTNQRNKSYSTKHKRSRKYRNVLQSRCNRWKK